ncbi:MAG: glycosyltransferase family 2 protein [Promethearchaeota archaeon]
MNYKINQNKLSYRFNNVKANNEFLFDYSYTLSIVIPVYNEERSIKEVINNIPDHNQYEIIVVNDGSTDNTFRILQDIEREIIVISHEENRGYGASILTGLEYATGDLIITMDSDGQHDPNEIPVLIEPIIQRKADIVIGSRYLGRSSYKVPLYTRTGEYFVKICLWLLFHQKIANNQSGFRAFSKRSIKILHEMVYTKFGLCTETLFKAAHNKLKIIEVPITISLRKYGNSHVKVVQIMKSITSCIISYLIIKSGVKKIITESIFEQAKLLFIKFFNIVN